MNTNTSTEMAPNTNTNKLKLNKKEKKHKWIKNKKNLVPVGVKLHRQVPPRGKQFSTGHQPVLNATFSAGQHDRY